jgi:hypothetical protein
MSYKIAGIDVHKKMLAVVVSDVEIESEYQFEWRMFNSNPEQLRSLAPPGGDGRSASRGALRPDVGRRAHADGATAAERAGVCPKECGGIYRGGKSKRGLSVCGCPHAPNLTLDFEAVQLYQLEKRERQPIVAGLRVVWHRFVQRRPSKHLVRNASLL